jgi:hypothetical protein
MVKMPARTSFSAPMGNGRFRIVNLREPENYEGGSWEQFVGVIDMDGNMVEPMRSVNEHYKFYYFGGGQYDNALYVNISTGAYFVHNNLPNFFAPTVNQTRVDNVRITNGKVDARFLGHNGVWSSAGFFHSYGEAQDAITGNISVLLGENTLVRDDSSESGAKLLGRNGNTLMTFPDGVRFVGDLLMDMKTQKIYDYNLNEVNIAGWPELLRHISGSVYVFRDSLQWSESTKEALVDISTGKLIEAENPWNAFEAAPGKFISNDTLYDINEGTSERILTEGFRSSFAGDEFLIVHYYWDIDYTRYYSNYGLCNTDGEEILPMIYTSLRPLSDRLFEVQIDNYMGVINEKGEWLIKIDMLRVRPD